MKVMILAAGLGTRLQPLTDVCPKPLVPLMLRPMLGYLLEQLQPYGVQEVVINLHHQAEQIRQWLGDGSQWGVRLHISHEHEILGTAGAIKRVETVLRDAPFVVMNADVVMDLDLSAVWQWHCQRNAMVTMVLRPDPAVRQYAPVLVDAADRICHINGHPDTRTHLPGDEMVFTGLQVLSPHVLDHIPPARVVSTTAETYPALIARDAPVYGYRYMGYWMDVGVPERYRQVHWDLLDGVLGDQWVRHMPSGTQIIRDANELPLGQEGVTIVPPVVLGPDIEFAPDSRVGPYAVLGSGCRLEAGAEVRESVLWERVRIGAGARVSGSILGTGDHVRAASVVCQAIRGV